MSIGSRKSASAGKRLNCQNNNAGAILGREPLTLDILKAVHDLTWSGDIGAHLSLRVTSHRETNLETAVVNLDDAVFHLQIDIRSSTIVKNRYTRIDDFLAIFGSLHQVAYNRGTILNDFIILIDKHKSLIDVLSQQRTSRQGH